MSPRPRRNPLRLSPVHGRLRLPVVFAGCLLLGFGITLTLRAGLGLGPYDVMIDGLAAQFGVTFGTASVVLSVAVVAAGWWLGGPVGAGTIVTMLAVGPAVDLWGWVLPWAPDGGFAAGALLLAGLLAIAFALATIIAAGLGAGPMEVLMLGLSGRGVPLRWVRSAMEATMAVAGWLLGGTLGAGTLIIAILIGHLIAAFVPRRIGFPGATRGALTS